MHWLFLLLALITFTIALSATQAWLLALTLLATLAFLALWLRGLYVTRVGATFSQTPRPLHQAELQALREQLRRANGDTATSAPSVPPASPSPQQPEWP